MQKFPSPTDWESELEFQSQKLDYAIVSWLFFLHSTTERTAHDVNKSEAFKWAGTNMRFKWDLSVEIGCFNWEMRWDERWEVVGKKKEWKDSEYIKEGSGLLSQMMMMPLAKEQWNWNCIFLSREAYCSFREEWVREMFTIYIKK